jgi:hypothetical protein
MSTAFALALIVIISAPCFAQLPSPETLGEVNGTGWRLLNDTQKTMFMAGVISGITIAREADCVLSKGKQPRPFFCEVAQPIELSDFLDSFYNEPENLPIRASGAIKVMILISTKKTPGTVMDEVLMERELARRSKKK